MIDTRPAMTYAEMKAMYPTLNERGIANYLALETRVHTTDFEVTRLARRRAGECLTQPRIREGTPWISDCLSHGVPATMAHHFEVNPDAPTD